MSTINNTMDRLADQLSRMEQDHAAAVEKTACIGGELGAVLGATLADLRVLIRAASNVRRAVVEVSEAARTRDSFGRGQDEMEHIARAVASELDRAD